MKLLIAVLTLFFLNVQGATIILTSDQQLNDLLKALSFKNETGAVQININDKLSNEWLTMSWE